MSGSPVAERYRTTERALWEHYGLTPTEAFVDAPSVGARIRVQQVGDGRPVLFVNGTGGPGAYFAPLLRELRGLRCLVLDRPGWGLSHPIDYVGRPYAQIVADVVRDVLDGLAIDRADVVGGSIGDLWALRFAQAHPARVEHVVLLGGGPLTHEVKVPPFIRLLRSPIGALIVRVPENSKMLRKQLAALGHGASLAAGRIPEAYISWHVAMSRETRWASPERAMVRAIVGSNGFVSGLVLSDDDKKKIGTPTLMVFGTADPTGSVDVWQRFCNALPRGQIRLVEGGGHLVWLDDPPTVGRAVQGFLQP